MAELVDWLNAQLDADERIARAAQRATDGRWHFSGGNGDPHLITRQPDKFGNVVVVYDEGSPSDEEAAHIAQHDPQSAIATIAALRAIMTIHAPAVHQAERYGRPHGEPHQYCVTCIGGTPCECCPVDHPDNQWPCPTVRALASAFAHRSGYESKWGPA